MFCPNCGNDCINVKFCPECGYDLREVSGHPEAKTEIPEPPNGKYDGTLGYVELGEECVTIHKKILFRTVERTMRYEDIVSVAYKRATGWSTGYLAIREKKERLMPLATEENAASDETALVFGSQMSETFYGIYEYLERFADKSDARAPVEPPAFAVAGIKGSGQSSRPTNNHVPAFSRSSQLPKMSARGEKKRELEKSGQVYCPKCLSTSVTANKKGFGIGKAVVGAAALGGIGLTAGNIGSKKVICTCLKCGYQWKAGKK